MTIALIVLLGVIGLLVLFGIFMWATYNSLVKLKIRVDEAWSDITVQLKRRTDLIPNLVGTVKGYAAHEKEVFENVAEARSAIMNAQGVQETAAAENMIEGALKSLFAVAEAYPELKANQNFIYNGGVRDLNTRIAMFPANIVAGMLGFKAREFFEVEDRASVENPVQVQF